jgi:phosphate transport system substrate-binding protein
MVFSTACGGEQPAATDENAPLEGYISISGAWALYPMMQTWAEKFIALNPGVTIDVSAGGAGKGMADALGDAVDIGMVSRDITTEEEDQGAYWVPVTKDAVFPDVSTQNPVLEDLLSQGISQETFIGIFITGEITTWGQVVGKAEITDEIHVYTRSDAAGAPEVWAKYLGKKQEDLLGIGVFGDPGLLDAVAKDPLGIGYNNLGHAYDYASGLPVTGTQTVPIDIDENGAADAEELLETKAEAVEAVALDKYPSPPARPLNLVTNGKPAGLVQAFLAWVLAEGQQFVGEAGYVTLPPSQIEAASLKVK